MNTNLEIKEKQLTWTQETNISSMCSFHARLNKRKGRVGPIHPFCKSIAWNFYYFLSCCDLILERLENLLRQMDKDTVFLLN